MFKILIFVVLLLILVSFLIPKHKRPRWLNFLPALALIFTLAHLFLVKYQWPMLPIYVLTGIIFIISLIDIKKFKQKKKSALEQLAANKLATETSIPAKTETRKFKIIRYVLTIGGLLYLIIAGVILFLFPTINLPPPSGQYMVGASFLKFFDPARPETLTENPEDFREFMARVWYPADSTTGKPMVYRENNKSLGVIESGGTPNFIFGHYNLSQTNSYLEAPISQKQSSYPIIIFSNGFLTYYDDYQLLMEELASQGYIVLAVNQPYESQSVIDAEGQISAFIQEHLINYQEDQKNTLPFWKIFWTSTDENEKKEIAKKILTSETFMDSTLRTRTADIQFMVTELEKINSGQQNSIFTSKLDLSRLGILGHSMGGAVAGQVCLTDTRFKAGINLDGFQWGDVIRGEIKQPFMIMYSEQFSGVNDFILDSFKNKLYLVTIKGSQHMNFDDNQIIMPSTKLIGLTGKIEPQKMRTISNGYILSFFDKYLNNSEAPFPSEILSNYPEVEIKIN